MDNANLTPITSKNDKNLSSSKKNKASANSFRKLYQKMVESKIRREKAEENRKRSRLASIIHKLLAGIPLTSDELQFLKVNAPMYYNQAIRQQRMHMTKNAGQQRLNEIDAIEPISPWR